MYELLAHRLPYDSLVCAHFKVSFSHSNTHFFQLERYAKRTGQCDIGMLVRGIVSQTSDCVRPEVPSKIPPIYVQLMRQCWYDDVYMGMYVLLTVV